jgi:hypothetical protein
VPANILNLPDFKVVRFEEADHDYNVYAEGITPTRTASTTEELRGRHKHTDRATRIRATVSL